MMTTRDDYPPNIIESSRLLATVIVLIHYPYTLNLDKLEILSTEFSDIEDGKEQAVITFRTK